MGRESSKDESQTSHDTNDNTQSPQIGSVEPFMDMVMNPLATDDEEVQPTMPHMNSRNAALPSYKETYNYKSIEGI